MQIEYVGAQSFYINSLMLKIKKFVLINVNDIVSDFTFNPVSHPTNLKQIVINPENTSSKLWSDEWRVT